jgi:hypothetical protein
VLLAATFHEWIDIFADPAGNGGFFWSDLASGPGWRIAMRRFYMLANPVCVFVVSRVADRYLWDEVVRNHGYDVLPKPLRREQVIRSVELAWYWRAWQQQWTGDRNNAGDAK